jgi:hypothetical protein
MVNENDASGATTYRIGTYPYFVFYKNQFHLSMFLELANDFQANRQIWFWEGNYLETLNVAGEFLRYVERSAFAARIGSQFPTFYPVASTHQLLLQMALIRSVDHFLMYLADMMLLILATDDAVLRKNKDAIMKSANKQLDEHTSDLAQAIGIHVQSLSRRGLFNLNQYFSENIGFELFPPKANYSFGVWSDYYAANETVNLRHILVHNHSVVDERYMKHSASGYFELGESPDLEFEWVIERGGELSRWAADIDQRAAQQFGLFRQTIPEYRPPDWGV